MALTSSLVSRCPVADGSMLAELARLNKKVASAAEALASAEARAEASEQGLKEWRECARLAQVRADAAAAKAAKTGRLRKPPAGDPGAHSSLPAHAQGQEALQLQPPLPTDAQLRCSSSGSRCPRPASSGEPSSCSPQLGARLRACAGVLDGRLPAGGPQALDGFRGLVESLESRLGLGPGWEAAGGHVAAPPPPLATTTLHSEGPAPRRHSRGMSGLSDEGRPPPGVWEHTLSDAAVQERRSWVDAGSRRSTPRSPVSFARMLEPPAVAKAAEPAAKAPAEAASPRGTSGTAPKQPPGMPKLRRMSDTRTSFESEYQDNSTMQSQTCNLEEVAVQTLGQEEAQGKVGFYAAQWDSGSSGSRTSRSANSEDGVACALCALDLVCNGAEGGAMIVMGPNAELRQLVKNVRTSDDGYMTRRLRGVHIASSEFKDVFRAFTKHSDTDRWPEDWPDEDARNLPADIPIRNLMHFEVSNGHIVVFDGKDKHHLMKEQPHVANWEEVQDRLVKKAGEDDRVEDIAELLDGLLDASGQPVVSLRKCRGHPKDGAIIMSKRGYRLMCAVKVIGLPMARLRWAGVGTRHEAALQLASALRQCVVFVRSDSGTVHLLCKACASDQPEVLVVTGAAAGAEAAAGDGGRLRAPAARFVFSSEERIGAVYDMDKITLGQGGHGSVRKAVHKRTKQERAIKIVQKAKVVDGNELSMETRVVKLLDHPNITKLIEVFEDYRNMYLVQELLEGGDLFSNILQTGHFTERQAAVAMQQVLRGVRYLHSHFVCHRDLKPENFMLEHSAPLDEGNTVKIIDFGLATFFRPNRHLTACVGTPHFLAPEVIDGHYGCECDLWSCGVSLYMLLCGRPPFGGRGKAVIFDNVRRQPVDFSHQSWASVSAEAKATIQRLLERRCELRLTAEQALSQEWVEKHAPQSHHAELPKSFFSDLERLCSMNRFQRAALHMIVGEMKGSDMKKLTDAWNALDTNKDGHLSLAEIHASLQSVDVAGIRDLVSAHFDSDHGLDYTEFILTATDKRKLMHEDLCWNAFHAFDRNGDGTISQSEIHQVMDDKDLNKALAQYDFDVEQVLREADADHSGSIEFEEFVKMVRRACSGLCESEA